ncbi:MAG: MFS transporter, partial [Campylobacteraceae bacterium]
MSSVYKVWIPVFCLSFSAFIFNTTEFVPIALLSDIAKDFSISEAKAGHMITLYAWCVTILSLPLMLLTAKVERKKLLMFLFVIFIVGHLLSFFAWNFYVLLGGRFFIACAHAVFWSITASLAFRLAPNGKGARALSFLATGSALATVLGLPLGRMIGQAFGWRETFLVIGILALFAMLSLFRYLPVSPSGKVGNLKSVPMLFKRGMLVSVFLLTALVVTAQFCAYSYIEPFTIQVSNFSESFAT